MTTKDGLFEEQDFERLDALRKDMLKKQKAVLNSNAHIIQWGMVVEAMLNDGSLDKEEWITNCTKYLEGNAQACALAKLSSTE